MRRRKSLRLEQKQRKLIQRTQQLKQVRLLKKLLMPKWKNSRLIMKLNKLLLKLPNRKKKKQELSLKPEMQQLRVAESSGLQICQKSTSADTFKLKLTKLEVNLLKSRTKKERTLILPTPILMTNE